MTRCLTCAAENEDAALACQRCGRALPWRQPRSPQWQRTLGWTLVWAAFATAVSEPLLIPFTFCSIVAGWVLFLDDHWAMRIILGVLVAVVMCALALALGERFAPAGILR